MDQILTRLYHNKICPVCGQAHYENGAGVNCNRWEATVCMSHCYNNCEYLEYSNCSYEQEKKWKKQLNEFYRKNYPENKKTPYPKGTASNPKDN